MDLTHFVSKFYAARYIHFVSVFLCWTSHELQQFQKEASNYNIRTNVVQDFLSYEFSPEGLLFQQGVVLDVGCEDSVVVIQKVSQSRAFNYRHLWLLIDNNPYNESNILTILSDAAVLPDSDVTWLSIGNTSEVYRINKNEPLKISGLDIDIDSSVTELSEYWTQRPTHVKRRKNLEGVIVKAGIIVSRPDVFKGWDDISMNTRHIDTIAKSARGLTSVLGEDLNVRYEYLQTDKYGYMKNGTFDGIIGMYQRNKIEISMTTLSIRRDRMEHVHFVGDGFRASTTFIFHQPRQSSVSNIFILPLSRSVWLAGVMFFSLVSVYLAVVSKYFEYLDERLQVIDFGETFTFVVGTLCQQGFHTTPRLKSVRVLIFFSLVMSLFLFTSYSAKIVALLQAPSSAIRTLADLAASPLECGVQDTPYKLQYYLENPRPETKLLYEKKLAPLGSSAFSYSIEEGIERLRTQQFAFQVEPNSGFFAISNTFTESEKCGLETIRPFDIPPHSLPIKKHSGYRELISARLIWIRECGLFNQVKRIWFPRKPGCGGNVSNFVSVGLRDILPAIHIFIIGIGISIGIFVLEILVKNFHKFRHMSSCFMEKF